MKESVVVITGAGLTAAKDFFGITTASLTKDLVFYNHNDLTDDNQLISFIYAEFCSINQLDPLKIDDNISQINFETILQIIEELYAYVEDVERTYHKSKWQNSVKTTVYTLNKNLIKRICEVRIPKYKNRTYLFIEKIYNHLIDELIRQITPKNNDVNNSGMLGFKKFLDDQFDSSKYSRRIYTLNYDNWLNKFADYFDGFINNQFNFKQVLKDKEIDCHYNLHGCILWQGQMSNVKFDKPEERKHLQSFDGYMISREALLPSPIISGYNKLTRINSSPLLEIFHSLTTDCLSASKVLVIGYSFNDPHLNNNLKLINKDAKVVVVVFYPKTYLDNHESGIHKIIWELENIFGTVFTDHSIRNGLNHTFDSEDGRVSIFIDGIGQTFYDEFPFI